MSINVEYETVKDFDDTYKTYVNVSIQDIKEYTNVSHIKKYIKDLTEALKVFEKHKQNEIINLGDGNFYILRDATDKETNKFCNEQIKLINEDVDRKQKEEKETLVELMKKYPEIVRRNV
jgi:hypothetical protein